MFHDAIAIGIGATDQIIGKWIKKSKNYAHLSPWHTAFINVSGSALLGCIMTIPVCKDCLVKTPRFRLLMGVGYCGSFTTFSTYSVDFVEIIQDGKTTQALSYAFINNVCGIAA